MKRDEVQKIIKEEWEEFIISEVEYQDDDKIDFSKIDLYNEYHKLNEPLFGSSVPEVPMKWSKRKTALGHVKFWRNRSTGEVIKQELWISTFFDVTYRQFLNVLAHEMIHVFLNSSEYPPREAHGRRFMEQAQRINSMGLGFNITKSNGEDIAMSSVALQRAVGKNFIALLFDFDGKQYIAVTSRQVYERDFESLVTLFERVINQRGKFNRVEINVVESQNPQLMKYRQQRNFTGNVGYAPLTDELMEELLDDNIIKTVTLERGQERMVAETIR